MHHRHTARRRVLIASCEKEFGEETDISSNGKALGQIGTIAANKALALCRIDRVHDSIQAGNAITVGDQVIALELPPSVTYSWPAEAEDG